MVDDVIRLIRGRAEGSGISIQWEPPAHLPALRADERRLKQILINILSNSVKFTPSGGTVGITGTLQDNGALRIEINDTGIGIAEDDIATARARFGRIESAANRKHPGTGLGLTLAIELTRLHGGELDLRSVVGEGTTVSLLFPRERTVLLPSEAGGLGDD